MHSLSKLALSVLPAMVAALPAVYEEPTYAPNAEYTNTFTAVAPNVEYTDTFSANAPSDVYTDTYTPVYPTVEYTDTFTVIPAETTSYGYGDGYPYPSDTAIPTDLSTEYPTATDSPEEPCTTSSDVYATSTEVPFEYNPGYGASTDIAAEPETTAYDELTTTIQTTVVETVEVTIYPEEIPATAADVVPTDAGYPVDAGVCTARQPTTTTTTVKVTVTVYPGASSVDAVAETSTPCSTSTELPFSFYSSEIADSYPTSTEVAVEYPTSTEVAAEPSYYPVSTEEPVEEYTPVATPVAAAVATPSYTPVKSSGAGKRGLAYNDASLTKPFVGNPEFSWGYNWGATPGDLDSSFEYIPMLWGTGNQFTGSWMKSVKAAFSKGCGHVLAYNEPDHAEQANISPSVAAAGWLAFMEPLKAIHPGVKLGAPAVTNGGGSMGLGWLAPFLKLCVTCNIDFVPIHWYDSAQNVEYFKKHVEDAHSLSGKPIWVTEFGASGSDAEVAAFLEEVLPWLDSQDYVERYAYFMVAQGKLVNGGSLSSYGKSYAS